VRGWEWDSMLAAHILDNRPGITGLKFQSYVHFGIVDYNSDVSAYIHSTSKSGNEFNSLDKLVQKPMGKDKLLKYCGLDAIHEYRLALLQQEVMEYSFLPF
jgi:hypothetical protein